MPIKIKKHGVKDAPAPVELAPQPPAVAEGETSRRVRILKVLTWRGKIYRPGEVARLPVDTARTWIGYGLAEEDKMIDGAPEVKAGPQPGKSAVRSGPNVTLEVLQGTAPEPPPPAGKK